MALDIQSPFLIGPRLVLLLADSYRHFGFLHPLQLALQAGRNSEQLDSFCILTLHISCLCGLKIECI